MSEALEIELNSQIAKLTFMTHGLVGCDWRTHREFVAYGKGNEFEEIKQSAELLRRARDELSRLRAEMAEWKQAAGVEASLRREFLEERDRLRAEVEAKDRELTRCWAFGIETFACEECRS